MVVLSTQDMGRYVFDFLNHTEIELISGLVE